MQKQFSIFSQIRIYELTKIYFLSFILDYGLDDKGYCRNLPFVGYDEYF